METDVKSVNVEVSEAFIVKPDADELCRLCANTDNQLIPIFRGEGLEHNLSHKIETHLPIIKVTDVDKLPLQICYQCASTLISWHTLYEGCRVADKRLREILSIDEKLHQEDETYGDYVDDYRDDYGDETHESLPTSTPNTSNLESNTLKNSSTELTTLSDTKILNETESDGNDERYVASSRTSKKSERKKRRSRSEPVTGVANLAISVGSQEHRSSPRRSLKFRKKTPVSSKLVSILPKPEVIINQPSFVVMLKATESICKQSCDKSGQTFARVTSLKKRKSEGTCDNKKKSRRLLQLQLRSRQAHPEPIKSKKLPAAQKPARVHQKITCGTCGKMFANKYNLSAHVQGVHKKIIGDVSRLHKAYREKIAFARNYTTKDDDGTEIFNCDYCCYRTKVRFRFYEHHRTHTGERPFTCHDCGKRFTTKAYIKKHIVTVHQRVKNYPCDICGQAFSDPRYTVSHRRRHTGERPYVCELCGKAYAQSATLMQHMQFHLDERNYECDDCGKKFVRRGHLVVHLKRHNGIKDYVCEVCGKAFVANRMLQDHGVVHSQDRPFKCELCGAGFKLKKHLVQHGRTHRN